MKLISMTDFVLQEHNKFCDLPYKELEKEYDYSLTLIANIRNYVEFLKQKLEIWMFVPAKLVNGEWVVLEEPLQQKETYKFIDIRDQEAFDSVKWTADFVEYQEAKERVLFEGFEIVDLYDGVKRLASPCGSYNLFWYSEEKGWYFSRGVDGQTVEYLAKEKLDLTQSAIKQIGL